MDTTRVVSLVAAENKYWDPYSRDVGRWHDGRHGTILLSVAQDPQFLQDCRQVRGDIERHFATHPSMPCTIVFRCRWGHRRSVALAYLFSVALSSYPHVEVQTLTPALRSACGCPADCRRMHRRGAEHTHHWHAVQEASRRVHYTYWNCWG